MTSANPSTKPSAKPRPVLHRDGDDRQRMITEHLGLVHFVARQVSRGIRMDLEFDELISAGTLGLISAVDSFDASRGLAFSTYAAPRIRGSMLDELRRHDHVPRSIRRKTRELKSAQESLGHAAGMQPSDRETASELGIDLQTLWKWQTDVEAAVHVSLDGDVSGEDGGPSPAELMGGTVESDVEDRLTLSMEVEYLRDAILTLKEQERVVLSLYYEEDLKLHEIAVALGITESRVSQIRSKAIANLRTKLAPLRAQVA